MPFSSAKHRTKFLMRVLLQEKNVVHTINSLSVLEYQFLHLQILAELQETRKKVYKFDDRKKWIESELTICYYVVRVHNPFSHCLVILFLDFLI